MKYTKIIALMLAAFALMLPLSGQAQAHGRIIVRGYAPGVPYYYPYPPYYPPYPYYAYAPYPYPPYAPYAPPPAAYMAAPPPAIIGGIGIRIH